jgi:multiple sugar transport system permease protein
VLGVVALVLVPSLATVTLGFTEFSGLEPPRFNGIDNYRRILDDGALLAAVRSSLLVLAISVPLRLALALGFALLLHKRGGLRGAGRTAAYLPSIVPEAALSLLWLWILNPLYGPVAALFRGAGLPAPALLTQPAGARLAVAVVAAFQIGETFLVVLTARRLIPTSIYDAAAADGARRWMVARSITLPLLVPVLMLLAVRDAVAGLQGNFVLPFLLTGGGPDGATTLLPLYTYQVSFRYFRLGYGAAISVVTLAVTGAAILAQLRLVRRYASSLWRP